LSKNTRPYLKKTAKAKKKKKKKKEGWAVAQVVQCLPSKLKALTSNFTTSNNK
jgi:hypothetical protein